MVDKLLVFEKNNQSRSTTKRHKLITPFLLQEPSLWVTLSEIRFQRQQWRLQFWSNHLSRTQHSTLSYSRWL